MEGPAGGNRGFRLLTAFAAEWWSPPEGTGGDGRRREASPQSYPRFAAAHTPVYSATCTIPRNALALRGIPRPHPVWPGRPKGLPSGQMFEIMVLRLQSRKSQIVNRTSILLPRPSGTPSATEGELASPSRKSQIANRKSHIAPHSFNFESMMMVTGPSLTSCTCILAPKTPFLTSFPQFSAKRSQYFS